MVYFLEIQAIEEENKELKDLLDKGLIKKAYDSELIYAILEDNINKVKECLTKYEEFYELLDPLEYAEERYENGDYKLSIEVDATISIELNLVLQSIKDFDDIYWMFNEERMNKVYNSENIEESFKELLNTICRQYLKGKLNIALDEVDKSSLW
jgi:hypothetical protein